MVENYRKAIQYNRIPLPNGSGMIWSYGVNNYHAVDNSNKTLYIAATNRGVNYFHRWNKWNKIPAPHTIEQGLRNGTIVALDLEQEKLNGNTRQNSHQEFLH